MCHRLDVTQKLGISAIFGLLIFIGLILGIGAHGRDSGGG